MLGLVDERISRQAPFAAVNWLPGGIRIRQRFPIGRVAGGGPRGPIREFSEASRRRLRFRLLGVPVPYVSLHEVTLTYPASYPDDNETTKRHLDNYRHELMLDWGANGPTVLWVREWQARGAAHFHLLIVWEREPAVWAFRSWSKRTWFRIVGSGDERHADQGSWDRIWDFSAKGAVARYVHYFSKYLQKRGPSKSSDPTVGSGSGPGRFWGTWGAFPCEVLSSFLMEGDEYAQLLRRVRRWGGQRSRYFARLGKGIYNPTLVGSPVDWSWAFRGLRQDESEPLLRAPPPPAIDGPCQPEYNQDRLSPF